MRQTLVTLACCGALATVAAAQTAREGRLLLTVIDPSGLIVPGAVVTIAGADAAPLPPATTGPKGVATVEHLPPGVYSVRAEYSGFETGTLKDVRIRPGDNKHVLVLALQKLQDSVTVARDAQAVAADRRSAGVAALTKEEIEALSDDPDEMLQQLLDMASANAIIKVDSFLGAPLPPKAQIKSIHIVRDAFAAENHSAESDHIEIITQPGVGPLRGGFNSRFRDGSMSAKSPFTPTKGPERTQNYEGRIGGTFAKNKSSFSISGGARKSFDTPIVNVALPGGGTRSEVLDLRRPNDNWRLHGLVDYALTRDQTLRFGFEESRTTRRNLGVGAFDLAERAFSTESRSHEVRVQEVGPIGRRMFMNTRLQLSWSDSVSQSALEAPTIRINDASTSGGAQVSGGRHARDIELGSDVDYIRGLHTVRFGALVEGGRFRSDDASNYLGTYVFTSMAAFEARQPAAYTRRIGNPLIEYWNFETAAYVQDDIRVRKTLTLSPGIRYEAQTHLHDYNNVGPRFGITWAPRKSGTTTLRGSWGIFYNWLNQGIYEQTLRVDGFRQREVNIVSPAYPDPGSAGTVSAVNRYLLGDDLGMVRTMRVSAGIDQTIAPRVRASLGYSNIRGIGYFRGSNLNAPLGGVRPDPTFANVIEVVADARLHAQTLSASLNVNFAAPGRAAAVPRWNWRRTTIRVSYWLSRALNESDGAFWVPPTGTLATEWGPSPGDRRHRGAITLNTQALKNLNASFNLATTSGNPYTITTGLDDNGDSIFNDRPIGIGRNTVRTAGQWTWNANMSYGIPIGLAARPAQEHGDRAIDRGQGPQRYRLAFNVSITNLTNHANYTGYSGVMTSPFFEAPTAVANPRKIDFGLGFSF